MSGLTNKQIIELHNGVKNATFPPEFLEEVIHKEGLVSECEVLDFKVIGPVADSDYTKVMRDAIAFHNSYGGFIVFGVAEIEKDKRVEVCGIPENQNIHLQKFKECIRNYSGSDIRIQIFQKAINGKNLEILYIAKRGLGEKPVRFLKNGPEDKPGKPTFKKNEIVFRRIDCNAIASNPEDYDFLYSDRKPPSLELNQDIQELQEPLGNNLPDRTLICARFIGRSASISELWSWVADDFSRVRLIAGEGGLGKTSLAYRFCEEIVTRNVKPFDLVLWLTAKKRQFIASNDNFRESNHVDFESADSLYRAICLQLGCLQDELISLDTRELMQLALETCATVAPFLVVDDVDSLPPDDQKSVMEFGLRAPNTVKLLLTTRVNFSYAPENVLKLNGLDGEDFADYVKLLRSRYTLTEANARQIAKLHEATGGSPLFTDSLLRLERRGLTLDSAVSQWKGEKGIEARKAALQREVQQLSREAKRVLYVTSLLKNCSYTELVQIVGYSDQTLGDALQELDSLFLISAPAIAKEARYTVEPNTGSLVIETAGTLGIDHSALQQETKKSRTDAVGLSINRRLDKVGLAISQAMAKIKDRDPKAALETVIAASKQLSKPHPDLLLMSGRCHLAQRPPNFNHASKDFEQSFSLGQRKALLFTLWFQAEYGRGDLDATMEAINKAIDQPGIEPNEWLEKRAQVRIERARRRASATSRDSFYRELDEAVRDLRLALKNTRSTTEAARIERLVAQSYALKTSLLKSEVELSPNGIRALDSIQEVTKISKFDPEVLSHYFLAVKDIATLALSKFVGRPNGEIRDGLESHFRHARAIGSNCIQAGFSYVARDDFYLMSKVIDQYYSKRVI